tara:strand:- start:355 stop:804 length:450 start_codon:yes stop_codon:yes gene_type:complete
MVAAVAAAGAAKKGAENPWPLIIGAGALVLLSKWGFDAVKDKVDIVPEVSQFVPAVIGGGRKGTYIPDQEGLSPNPPTEGWWDDYSGDMGGGWWRRDRGPIPVEDGTAVPTAPVVTQRPLSKADIAGQQTHEWFTQPLLYPWFWLADKL